MIIDLDSGDPSIEAIGLDRQDSADHQKWPSVVSGLDTSEASEQIKQVQDVEQWPSIVDLDVQAPKSSEFTNRDSSSDDDLTVECDNGFADEILGELKFKDDE